MNENETLNELEIELDYETEMRIHWQVEADYWHREYLTLRKAWELHCNVFNKLKEGVKEWKPTIE